MKNTKFSWTYKIDHDLLNEEIIHFILTKFYNEVLSKLNQDQMVYILFKAKSTDGLFRTLAQAQKVTPKDINSLINILISSWSIKSEWYKTNQLDKIIINYILLPEGTNKSLTLLKPITSKSPEITYKLPNNTNISTWGTIIPKDSTLHIEVGNGNIYIIQIFEDRHVIELKMNDYSITTFVDYLGHNEVNFKRCVNSKETYYYKDGACVYMEKIKTTSFITKKATDSSIKQSFITMDFETRTLNGKMSVYAASIFDGKDTYSFYITDYNNNPELLITTALNMLLQRKYNGYKVYFHNFSNFDAIFMLKILATLKGTKISNIIKRETSIIEIRLDFNLSAKRKYTIYFRDSYLLLPSSLRKLGTSFNVGIVKSIFPYNFVNNELVNMEYIGKVPSIEFFDENLTMEEYNSYLDQFKGNSWNLKIETIKYCEIDVKSLWHILRAFQVSIFKTFLIDINKYPTLASLAFGIYRAKYLKENTIPKISGEIYNNIVKSYTGGSVDVYKPIGKNVNRYDVNSLYPSVMAKFASPTGNIRVFKGDVNHYVENPFGFFYVNVHAPLDLNVPILQTRISTSGGGTRTVAPTGTWSGWYFSEEIQNAIKYGYKIEIVWGYLFNKEYIFKQYVEDLYKIKQESIKDTPEYTISKLLLNSLYGRFGMSPNKEDHIILTDEESITKFYQDDKISITDDVTLSKNVVLLSYLNKSDDEDSVQNINVAIASSITSYARIVMSKVKIEYAGNLYYSDTDSIDLDIILPDKYVSEELGDYKHEGTFDEVVYIAPKVYSALKDGEQLIKIKGYKSNNVKFNDLKNIVLNKDKLQLIQNKYYKHIDEGYIFLKEDKYTLMVTENKRNLVYSKDSISTRPYNLVDGKLKKP